MREILLEMYTGLQAKYSCQILTKLEFFRVPETKQISNFMKILTLGVELSYAVGLTDRRIERQTDMKKIIVTFRNLANAPSNSGCPHCDKQHINISTHITT